MIKLMWLLFAGVTLSAMAGPNVAVFCKTDDNQSDLAIYDLSLKDSFHIMVFGGTFLLGGKSTGFTPDDLNLVAKLEKADDKLAVVSYSNRDKKPALLSLVSKGQATDKLLLGALKRITYGNSSPEVVTGRRKGSVLLEFENSPLQFAYPSCEYEGALVGKWKEMWKID